MKKILPNLFFLFLSAPILSPYIGGITIYLYAIIAVLDINFLNWIFKEFNAKQILTVCTWVILISLIGLHITLFFKIMMIVITVAYLFYCFRQKYLYLIYRYFIFSILFAFLQFVLLFYDPISAFIIGPTSISKLILGDYATPTYTNFHSIGFLPRVSGLCREGGFFSSFLTVGLFIVYLDNNLTKKRKRILYIFLVAGIAISLSKTSIILIFIPVVLLLKKYLNRFGLLLTGIYISIILSFIFIFVKYNTNLFYDLENETYIHRFAGYAFIDSVSLKGILLGTSVVDLFTSTGNIIIRSIGNSLADKSLNEFCSFPGIYLNFGFPTFILFLLFLKDIRFTTANLLLIFLFTASVTPFTCDNFVVMAWFLCFLLLYNEKQNSCDKISKTRK